jgi:hypothetical protein
MAGRKKCVGGPAIPRDADGRLIEDWEWQAENL